MICTNEFNNETCEIQVLDILGRQLYNSKIELNKNFSLARLTSGVYILNIKFMYHNLNFIVSIVD